MSAVCPNGHTSEADDYCDTCGSPIDASAQPAASAAPSAAAGAAAGSAASQGGSATGAAPGGRSSLDLDPSGAAEPATPAAPAEPATPTALACPNCGTENADGALFCEACGYDFTTGAMPRDAGGEASGSAPAAAAGDPTGAPAEPAAPAAEPFEWLAEVWIDPDWYQTQEAEDPCPSPGLPVIMPLRHKSVLLGRVSTSRNTHPEIDLSSDPGVSRRHAQLTTDGTRWFVEDLGSSNGTYVGPASGPLPDHPIPVGPKTELGDDDRLYVGAWTRVVVRRATPDEVDAYA
ncbi:FHA domain-containing protein [Intrasporangium flavum]|uniref:FHA domain-containing protein n=1 Tax=Intrasporangium flavum TaxID=1428657 RepID=UPI00096F8EF7|nr:FHA domain-containing protein [Intrasporangium flavum]